jgi:hypothetical protein
MQKYIKNDKFKKKMIKMILLAKVQGLAKTKIGSAAAVTFADPYH